MFESGNFLNFSVDDDISIGTACDLVRGSLSSINSSVSLAPSSSRKSRSFSVKGVPVYTHAQSYGFMEEIPEEQPIDRVHVKNTRDLCDSLRVILSMPTLCDVTFLVGASLQPIYGLKAVMSTRSRVLHSLFLKHHMIHNSASSEKPRKPVSCFPMLFNKKKRVDKETKPHIVITLPEHDPATFGAFVTYLHTGSLKINVSSVVGIIYLAEIYNVNQLRTVCWDFVDRCLTSRTAIVLLTSAHKYANSESVAHLITTILNFIDKNALSVLPTKAFMRSSLVIASLVLSRSQLNLSENDRVAAILSWSKRHHRDSTYDLLSTLNRLLDSLDFSRVTSSNLRNEVIELGFVPPMPVEKSLFTSSRLYIARERTNTSNQRSVKRDVKSHGSVAWTDSACDSGFSLAE